MRPALLVLALAVVACKPSGEGTPDASASPQASAEPAPLAAAPPTIASAMPALPEGGPPPVPVRGDEPLAGDSYGRETVGWTLSALFRAADVPVPPRAPEVNAAGLDAARKKTEPRLAIELSPSRMRIVLAGGGFVLPAETEIRARADRYGHIVLWPGGATYRSVAPGAMRALLGERRFDVAPIGTAEIVPSPDGGKRIGIKTRRLEVSTRAAKATFEIGKQEGLGEGGMLLCRLLLDLMNAPPQSAVCGLDELPMRVELRWTGHGSLGFEVTGVLKKTDMPQAQLLVPPPGASFARGPLPTAGVQVLLAPQELAALRNGPVDVPPVTTGDGLLVGNATVQLRMLYLDGVPVAWVAPGARDRIIGLTRGRYIAQWRTFLGDSLDPPVTLTVPGSTQIGGADAGAR